MKRGFACLVAAFGLLAAGCSPRLGVPPRLIASWPTDGARMSVSRQTLDLTFNRPLALGESWVSIHSQNSDVALNVETSLDPKDAHRLKIRVRDPVGGAFALHWHAVAADSHLAAEGDQSFTLEVEAPAPPRIDVSPSPAESGDVLELVGKGFARDSALQLTIGDVATPLATTRTDAAGKFNTQARVPAGVPLGVQPVTATDGAGRIAQGSVAVHWGGWPPVVAWDSGTPGPDRGEVTFTVSVRNVSDYVLEHVRVVMKDPDGGELVDSDPGAVRGERALEWDIAVMDRGTFGPFHATYRGDRPLVSRTWLEFRHRQERGCADEDCLPAFISSSIAESVEVFPL